MNRTPVFGQRRLPLRAFPPEADALCIARVVAMVVLGSIAACSPSDVKIVPPRVAEGGRATAIAVAQSDAKRLLVATESGGLFRTFNGGVSFQHLDGFPTLYAVDVAIASLDPNTMIATARDDFAKVTGGGIWRSTDGGGTWNRPMGWPPAGCSGRPAAAGISHMPLTRTFYVATDCGLAVSSDNGATFTTTPLDPNNKMLFSVLVLNRTTGVAADNRRTWFLNNGQWTPSLGGPDNGGILAPHAFASPWWAAGNIFYHAGRDGQLWVSTTSGGAWRRMLTYCDTLPSAVCGNREPFVRVGRGLDGDPTHVDVYYGDGTNLWREAVTVTVPAGPLADWRKLSSDHGDPADIAFTPGFSEPLMLATDGGVHLTTDKGKNWKYTGSNFGGFVALQVGEMTGRQVAGSASHLDLYYGTQDNGIRGSRDGGVTWTGAIGGEGAFVQADRVNPAMIDGQVTGRYCGGCKLFDAEAHLASSTLFRNAPGGTPADSFAHAPFQLIGPNYLQPVPVPPNEQYWLTGNRGSSWDSSFTVPGNHVGNILFSGDLGNPVTYVALENGQGARLMRASAVSGTPTVRAADSIGMGTIALLRTGQARYAVVGVDPKNSEHLIALDIDAPSGTKVSRDGGLSWFRLPALDSAASDSGRFMLSNNGAPFVTTIAWDPTNSCHILVGTMQNGVIRSADGGRTWAQVRGSKQAPIVTSFFFPPTGSIWMSTYGRGLWQVTVDRSPPSSRRCVFRQPVIEPSPPMVILRGAGAPRPFTGLRDSVVCSTCTVFLVHDGWITDIDGDGDVRVVATSGGFVEQRRPDGREAAVTITNRHGGDESDKLRGRVRGLANASHVRGLVLDGSRLVAFLVGSEPLPIAPIRKAAVFTRALTGDSVQVLGFQFLPGVGARGVTVLVEADTVLSGVPVSADGRFDAKVRVGRHPPGWVVVTAAQHDGLRTTLATSNVQVVAR
jgi:hypothetical protein